jgi:hypothetical protein
MHNPATTNANPKLFKCSGTVGIGVTTASLENIVGPDQLVELS